MEITKKAKFITDFYGGAPALGDQNVLQKYIETRIDKGLLSFADQIKKKSDTAESIVAEILSIFHRDDKGNPIIGNWMLKKCLIKTGQSIFNAMKDRTHPKRDIIANAIIEVEPIPYINLYDGNEKGNGRPPFHNRGEKIFEIKDIKDIDLKEKIIQPSGVRTYTVTVGKRSFFKAYEWIPKGSTFEFMTIFDDSLLSEKHMGMILEKAGRFGVGAFRERFGKFEIV